MRYETELTHMWPALSHLLVDVCAGEQTELCAADGGQLRAAGLCKFMTCSCVLGHEYACVVVMIM